MMKFLSTAYVRRENNTASLLLQQYRYGQAQILFACVCAGKEKDGDRAGGCLAEQLLQWFRGLRLKKLFKNQEKSISRLAAELYGVIRRIDRELETSGMTSKGRETDFVGIICLQDRYAALHRGKGSICLINTSFGRARIRDIAGKSEEGGLCMEQGILQPDIGLLLAMESFYTCVGKDRIKEGLAVEEMTEEEEMSRHLKELAREGERQKGADMSAVLLRTFSH